MEQFRNVYYSRNAVAGRPHMSLGSKCGETLYSDFGSRHYFRPYGCVNEQISEWKLAAVAGVTSGILK